MFNFYAFLDRMKYIRRWSLMRSVREENIMEHTEQVAVIAHALALIGNRFFGTIVGGFIGMGLFALYAVLFPQDDQRWVLIPLTFVGVVALILVCQLIWAGGVQPGGVMLCIILFNTPMESHLTYAFYRILDTGVGVLMALFVNGMLPGGFTFGFMHRFYLRLGIRDDV